jgi:hypothetical protein
MFLILIILPNDSLNVFMTTIKYVTIKSKSYLSINNLLSLIFLVTAKCRDQVD